jgi:hypothetical protein
MKKLLLLTAIALVVSVPATHGADLSKIPLIGGLFKKKTDKGEEILRMDPYKVTDGYDLGYSAPTIIRIVRPRVHSKYAGTHFDLKFTVDKSGTPYNLGSTDIMVDSELVFQVIGAVRAWQFSPARDTNGNPMERKVILPIIVVGADQRS